MVITNLKERWWPGGKKAALQQGGYDERGGHYELKGKIGARQKESFITAREYEGRGGHYEPKGKMGARQKGSFTTARAY